MEGGRQVRKFVWLFRHEVMVVWTRVVAVGGGWMNLRNKIDGTKQWSTNEGFK